MNNKIKCVISAPVSTYSGYGNRARDFIKQVITQYPEWDIKVLFQSWGNTRWGYLEDHNEKELLNRQLNKLTYQPDIFIQHSVPNEFQNIGKYNIGLTAGIETTVCDPSWIKGLNKMDLIIVSSEHAKKTFLDSKFDLTDKNTRQVTSRYEVETPIEAIFEGLDKNIFKPTQYKDINDSNLVKSIDSIEEQWCYLATGHWMQGSLGEDRKNIGLTIKTFLETFKNKNKQPGLILKSHTSSTSIMDRSKMLNKIESIRKTVKGKLPNIYLIHGEVQEKDMNNLYNHPKVKALISLTKGEGFGRPLLEFSFVNKPIIVSAWSGHMDFLDKNNTKLLPGVLKNVDKSAQVKNMILEQSQWFSPDTIEIGKAYKELYSNYKQWKIKAKKQGHVNRDMFSIEEMGTKLKSILDYRLPEFPKEVELKMPELNLPKL